MDITRMMASSMSSRISSAMICHFDSVMFIDVWTRPCAISSSWSANSLR